MREIIIISLFSLNTSIQFPFFFNLPLFEYSSVYLRNRFQVAVGLFSNRSQMTSKCDKIKNVAIVFKKTMTLFLASGLNVAVYSYSRFISLVIELTCYNSLEHLNHSHVAVPLYHIIKITSYYVVLYNKAVM